MPATDVKLTAQWKELQHYTVTFVGGEYEGTPYGGQTKIDTRNDSWEGAIFQIARAIKWGGYEFLGWDDGTGTLYQGNAEIEGTRRRIHGEVEEGPHPCRNLSVRFRAR